MRPLLCVITALDLLVAELPAQRVWVVAPTAGQGVDFTVIQGAVDAAADGDMVLVRAGTYANFSIIAKALSVVTDGPVQLVSGLAIFGLEVRNLAPTQSVVVRGISLSSGGSIPLGIVGCQGPVLIEASTFAAASPLSPFFVAASIATSSQVTLVGCSLTGGSGFRGPTGGMSVSGSTVHLHRCAVIGASWRPNVSFAGAVGASLYQTVMDASHCTFAGGTGGDGVNVMGTCFPPGDGGHAVLLQDASTHFTHLNCQFVPGMPGVPGQNCPPAGAAGLPIGGNGSAVQMVGVATGFAAPAVVRAGQAALLDCRGPSGFGVWLGLSAVQRPMFLAACRGAFQLDLASTTPVFLGSMPTSGRLQLNVPVPAQLGVLGIELYLQAVLVDVAVGCQLGAPSAVLLVDSRY